MLHRVANYTMSVVRANEPDCWGNKFLREETNLSGSFGSTFEAPSLVDLVPKGSVGESMEVADISLIPS